MAVQFIFTATHSKFVVEEAICLSKFFASASLVQSKKFGTTNCNFGKHWNPKFKKERKAKFLKIDLPDYDEERRDKDLSVEELKAKMKKKKILPVRPWTEKPVTFSCLGAIVDPYIPPEGDAKASLISGPGMKQTYDLVGKKGKSYLALRKIRSLDHEFDIPTVSEHVKDVYIKAHKALSNYTNNEDELHDLVTEKAFPEMIENVKNKIIKWNFIKTLDYPKITHIRVQEMGKSNNLFAQITLRLHSQQTLAVYDRFGRLMHGGENDVKDVIEYIVFEKHLTNRYGLWRIHGKVIPDWLPEKEPIKKTYLLPNIDEEFPAPPPAEIEKSAETENRPEATS